MSSNFNKANYHWCLVPQCTNTSVTTPDKTYIKVPTEPRRRKLWFEAIRRDFKTISNKSSVFVCQDHFDLENDMENYMRWKLTGGVKIMKKHVVPHKFDCQADRDLNIYKIYTKKRRSPAMKRKANKTKENNEITKVDECIISKDLVSPIKQEFIVQDQIGSLNGANSITTCIKKEVMEHDVDNGAISIIPSIKEKAEIKVEKSDDGAVNAPSSSTLYIKQEINSEMEVDKANDLEDPSYINPIIKPEYNEDSIDDDEETEEGIHKEHELSMNKKMCVSEDAKQIIRNVHATLKEQGQPAAILRTAELVKMSYEFVRYIINYIPLKSKRKREKFFRVDDTQKAAIVAKINESHSKNKLLSVCNLLKELADDGIQIGYKLTQFRLLLKDMGYSFKKSGKKQYILNSQKKVESSKNIEFVNCG